MRAKILIKSFFFIFVFCYFVIPNFVEADTLRNTCEYTYTYKTPLPIEPMVSDDVGVTSAKLSINLYGPDDRENDTLTKIDATLFEFFGASLNDENDTYEVKNWNQNYNFSFSIDPNVYVNDYDFNTEDGFKNVDSPLTIDNKVYISRTVTFPSYVSSTENYDFSQCPQYVYVADIYRENSDFNIFISNKNIDANAYSYTNLLTVYHVKAEQTNDFKYSDLDPRDNCAYSGWLTYHEQMINGSDVISDYKYCISNPYEKGNDPYYVYYQGNDGLMYPYNYIAVAASDPVSHYDETMDFNQKIGCENLFVMEEGSVGWILQRILNYIKIFGPIAVILLSAIDFIKAIMSSDEKLMQSVQSKFIIRLIAAIALFLIPLIVQLILNVFLGISNPTCGIQ